MHLQLPHARGHVRLVVQDGGHHDERCARPPARCRRSSSRGRWRGPSAPVTQRLISVTAICETGTAASRPEHDESTGVHTRRPAHPQQQPQQQRGEQRDAAEIGHGGARHIGSQEALPQRRADSRSAVRTPVGRPRSASSPDRPSAGLAGSGRGRLGVGDDALGGVQLAQAGCSSPAPRRHADSGRAWDSPCARTRGSAAGTRRRR